MEHLKQIFPELFDALMRGFTTPLRFSAQAILVCVYRSDEIHFLHGKFGMEIITCSSHQATLYLVTIDNSPFGSAIEYWDF